MSETAAIISIAGTDPGQGAGLQMDQSVAVALGAKFYPVIAVYTEQDELGLKAVAPRDADDVAADLEQAIHIAGRDDGLATCAVKTGALGSAAIVAAIAAVLEAYPKLPLVVDPVCKASRNHDPDLRLLTDDGWQLAIQRLLPRCTVVTPNLAEFGDGSEYTRCKAVLLKGGHRRLQPADLCVEDLLLRPGHQPYSFAHQRIRGGTAVHGTGCVLSTAIAYFLACGESLTQAISRAREYLHRWMATVVASNSAEC